MKNHTFAICAYKKSPYLEMCIQSLKAQSVQSNIIIVTSTPNEFIQGIAEKNQVSYYVNVGDKGITQDWNFGYECARIKYNSEYITIAHQDDFYEPEYLENVLKVMQKAKKPLIFFSDYYEIRNGKKVLTNLLLKIKRIMLLPLRIKMLQRSRWIRRRILSFGSPICCPSVTFAAGNLPPVIFENHFRACEDWEAWEKLSKFKGDFLYCPKKLVGHRIHEDSETSAIIGDNMRTTEEYEMFCKFWPKWIAKALGKKYAKSQESNQLKV